MKTWKISKVFSVIVHARRLMMSHHPPPWIYHRTGNKIFKNWLIHLGESCLVTHKSTRESFPSLHHGVPELAHIKDATDDQVNQTELKPLAFCTSRLTTQLVNTSGEGEHRKKFHILPEEVCLHLERLRMVFPLLLAAGALDKLVTLAQVGKTT